jgi:two-component system, NtrC family, sensor kinase
MIRSNILKYNILLIVIFFLLNSNLLSQERYIFDYNIPTVSLNSDLNKINMKNKYAIFKSKVAIDDLRVSSDTLKEVSDLNLNYGYTTDIYYLYFRLDLSSIKDNKVYLKFNFPLIDQIKLTCYDISKNMHTFYSGDHISNNNKLSIYRLPVLQLQNDYNECWVEIINQESMQLESEILIESSLNEEILNDNIFQSFYFGSIISLIIYNLTYFIFSNLIVYLVYSIALSQYLLFIFLFNGFGSFIIWHEYSNYFTDHSLIYSILSGVLLTIFYFINIIELKIIKEREYLVFKLLILLISLEFFLYFFLEYYIHIQIVLITMFFCIMYIFFIGFNYYNIFKILKLYMISWSIFILGAIILSLKGFGFINSNIFIDHAFHIGLYSQQILLSVLISQRIELARDEISKKLMLTIENKNNLLESEKLKALEISKLNQELELSKERATKAYLDLEASQKQLVQSDKMITLGTMVAGVAHEINTPLGAIKANSENILESLRGLIQKINPSFTHITLDDLKNSISVLELTKDPSTAVSSREARAIRKKVLSILEAKGTKNVEVIADYIVDLGLVEALEQEEPILSHTEIEKYLSIANDLFGIRKKSTVIQTSAERVSKIVKSLKSFMHFDQNETKMMSDLTEGMETVLIILHNKIKYGIEVIKNYGDNVPQIPCYPDELNQVWTNLIHNAIQAMSEKGTLQIDIERLTNLTGTPDIDKRNPDYKGGYVAVSIQDSGSGISPEIRTKIFQAFFTTKPAGEGSGLGLHIIGKILEKHAGALYLESEPGKTRFTVILPVETTLV